jgi:hypothetical protein
MTRVLSSPSPTTVVMHTMRHALSLVSFSGIRVALSAAKGVDALRDTAAAAMPVTLETSDGAGPFTAHVVDDDEPANHMAATAQEATSDTECEARGRASKQKSDALGSSPKTATPTEGISADAGEDGPLDTDAENPVRHQPTPLFLLQVPPLPPPPLSCT